MSTSSVPNLIIGPSRRCVEQEVRRLALVVLPTCVFFVFGLFLSVGLGVLPSSPSLTCEKRVRTRRPTCCCRCPWQSKDQRTRCVLMRVVLHSLFLFVPLRRDNEYRFGRRCRAQRKLPSTSLRGCCCRCRCRCCCCLLFRRRAGRGMHTMPCANRCARWS